MYINNVQVSVNVSILFSVELYKPETMVTKETPELYLFSSLQITCKCILKPNSFTLLKT